MTHIIKMFHRVTDDGKGVYLTCEEAGVQRFASDIKKNGMFHPYGPGGAPMHADSVWLYDAYTQQICLSFAVGTLGGMYSGSILDANNNVCGEMQQIGIGADRYYHVNAYGNTFECYKWAHQRDRCFMIYKNGVQKAMLIEDNLSVNGMYSMTMHIIDDQDIPLICLIGLIYHQFENVRDMNSKYHRNFVKNGWSVKFAQSSANYKMDIPISGAGKTRYNPNFLRAFYPEGHPILIEQNNSVGAVFAEAGEGFRKSVGQIYSKENIKTAWFGKVPVIFMSIMTVVMGIIFGCIIGSLAGQMGIDLYVYSGGVRFLIGFLVGAGMMLLLWGIFTLFVLGISKAFGNKSQ